MKIQMGLWGWGGWFVKALNVILNGAQSWNFELFWPKLLLHGRKPENNSLLK